ncbi:PAS domain-containing sensor histidine kinase [Ochrobactrum soli]|nr:ATP-binding protein [[Ochrobactrum] soli]
MVRRRSADSLWSNSDELFLLVNARGVVIDANPAFVREAMAGRQVFGRHIEDLFDCASAKNFVASCKKAIESKREQRLTASFADAETRCFRWKIIAAPRRCAIAVGSTERPATGFDLADPYQLLDLANDAIVVRELSGDVVYWNSGAERLYGYSREQALGSRLPDLLDTEGSSELRSVGQAFLLSTGSWKGELMQRSASGVTIKVSCNWTLIERDGASRVVEIYSDLTAASKTMEALERSESRFRSIFESNSVALLEMDFTRVFNELAATPGLAELVRDRPSEIDKNVSQRLLAWIRINDCNQAAVRMLGLSHKSEVLGGAQRWISANDCNVPAMLKALLERDSIFEDVCTINAVDGTSLTVAIGFSFSSQDFELDRVVVAILDVSGAHEHREELARAHFRLAKEGRAAAVGAFSASIVHELNQPLAALLMNVSASIRWMNRAEPNLEAARNSAMHAKLQGERARSILERTKARMTTERMKVDRYQLPELVRNTVTILARDLEAADVEIDVQISEDITEMIGDPVGVQQVLVNLINNGIEAMTGPIAYKCLSLTVAPGESGFVRLSVSDTGHGIVPENEGHIFTPFFTTKPSGMGIGLAICVSILEIAGGSLTARNNNDRGATFEVILPLSPPGTSEVHR